MMQHYLQLKEENPEPILMYRLGDFYEMFFEDAKICSRELDLVLTGRAAGKEKAPMCGVPHHSVQSYISRLIKKGYKVAICEQLEDPSKAKGLHMVSRIQNAPCIPFQACLAFTASGIPRGSSH